MPITAKEIARRLGLSEAAVSLALNNRPGVSTSTRQLVWDTAKELGYDFTRNHFKTQRSRGAVLLLKYMKTGALSHDGPYFTHLIEGARTGCRRSGLSLEIRTVYEDERIEDQLYTLEQEKWAGLILLATEMDRTSLRHFDAFKLPIILLDAQIEGARFDSVSIHNDQGAVMAVSHLIAKTRALPGYLHSSYASPNFEARFTGFYRGVRQHGMSTASCVLHLLSPSEEGAYADMKEHLRHGEALARCYFADSDAIAAGAMRALQEAGYRIPEDVAVVGFDDLPLCETTVPPLTSIHVPARYMGEMAALRLSQVIEGGAHFPMRMEIGASLKKRRSV